MYIQIDPPTLAGRFGQIIDNFSQSEEETTEKTLETIQLTVGNNF